MRILFFTDNFKPECNPPATHVFERARLWVRWGHDVTVITTAPNFPEGKVYPGYKNRWRFVEEMDGIRVVRVKSFMAANAGFMLRVLDFISFAIMALVMAQFEKKPDVVISTSPQLFTPVAGLAYAKLRRRPHVFELRDLWPASIMATDSISKKLMPVYRLLERLELLLYRHSTRIQSVTHSFVEDLVSRGVPADKIDVVINGTNLDMFSPQPKDEELEKELGLKGRFVVGYLGTLGLAHGLENVLHTAARMRNCPVTFLLVGAGAARERLMEMAREMQLTNVVFVPRRPKEEMPRYWSVCDASLIHLRNSDVFKTVIPTKIFESMAMALPIIYAAPAGEASALIERHQAGVVVPPADPEALSSAICSLANDRERWQDLSANALDTAPQYSREKQANGTLAVLENAFWAQKRFPTEAMPANTGLAVADVHLRNGGHPSVPGPSRLEVDGEKESLQGSILAEYPRNR